MSDLPTASDPILQQVNRLRGLLAVLEQYEPMEPMPAGAAWPTAEPRPGPTFDEMMAVIQQRGKR